MGNMKLQEPVEEIVLRISPQHIPLLRFVREFIQGPDGMRVLSTNERDEANLLIREFEQISRDNGLRLSLYNQLVQQLHGLIARINEARLLEGEGKVAHRRAVIKKDKIIYKISGKRHTINIKHIKHSSKFNAKLVKLLEKAINVLIRRKRRRLSKKSNKDLGKGGVGVFDINAKGGVSNAERELSKEVQNQLAILNLKKLGNNSTQADKNDKKVLEDLTKALLEGNQNTRLALMSGNENTRNATLLAKNRLQITDLVSANEQKKSLLEKAFNTKYGSVKGPLFKVLHPNTKNVPKVVRDQTPSEILKLGLKDDDLYLLELVKQSADIENLLTTTKPKPPTPPKKITPPNTQPPSPPKTTPLSASVSSSSASSARAPPSMQKSNYGLRLKRATVPQLVGEYFKPQTQNEKDDIVNELITKLNDVNDTLAKQYLNTYKNSKNYENRKELYSIIVEELENRLNPSSAAKILTASDSEPDSDSETTGDGAILKSYMKGNKGLTNFQINAIMSKYAKYGYIDAIKLEELDSPRIIKAIGNKINYSLVVLIPWEQDEPGRGHWIGLDICELGDDAGIHYYDSFGEPPSDEFKMRLKRLMNKTLPSSYLTFEYNTKKEQSVSSKNCGWFVIRWLISMYKGIEKTKIKDVSGEGERSIERFKELF